MKRTLIILAIMALYIVLMPQIRLVWQIVITFLLICAACFYIAIEEAKEMPDDYEI